MADAERERLDETVHRDADWERWGPYVSERAWGTVREDYSHDGDAWHYFPFEHSRSRAYRWSEDGLAGICDDHQILCFGLALHNGRDPFLKERIFGLANPQGNHGEDAKDYWWYLDSTPTHSWMVWRYHYPQTAFPYELLVEENSLENRSRLEPEFELVDTGVFDEGGWWEVEARYAKAAPDDILITIRVTNASETEETLDLLPTLWFRNTWSWGLDDRKPHIKEEGGVLIADHPESGTFRLVASGDPEPLFCENETNRMLLWGEENTTAYPKDGINDHVVDGADTVNPERRGTKAALRYRIRLGGGESAEVRLRLTLEDDLDLEKGFESVWNQRSKEADEFYAELTPKGATDEEAMVMRQAFAGMLWTKQFYHYDVERWLVGDPAGPVPPHERQHGRNAAWRHLDNFDVVSMPDKWEYPWYAVWDLAFHCVALAHVDPDYAKDQLLLALREWYQHPNGQIPAYEWNFSDVNPPVHAWGCLKVFQIDGSKDTDFLARCFHKLLMNFTWWVNKKDREGNNVFEGGFLGLDNIGPIDRSEVPEGAHIEQSDGTAWMALYSLNLLEMALILSEKDRTYEDVASKFFEHFCYIASSINSPDLHVDTLHGLWDSSDGFYYDVIHSPDGRAAHLKVRSMVGLIVLYAAFVLHRAELDHLPDFVDRKLWFLEDKVHMIGAVPHIEVVGEADARLLSIVGPERLQMILKKMLAPEEFLSDYGIRGLSACHREEPFELKLGDAIHTVEYTPAESTTGMFGGNSNWRGPIWFPVNYLLIESLRSFHHFMGDGFKVEYPVGTGKAATLEQVADDIARRLVSIFLEDSKGRRPVFGDHELFQTHPSWKDLIPFYEYFHGDTGRGVGASHQTGWTGLVADLITTGRGIAAGPGG